MEGFRTEKSHSFLIFNFSAWWGSWWCLIIMFRWFHKYTPMNGLSSHEKWTVEEGRIRRERQRRIERKNGFGLLIPFRCVSLCMRFEWTAFFIPFFMTLSLKITTVNLLLASMTEYVTLTTTVIIVIRTTAFVMAIVYDWTNSQVVTSIPLWIVSSISSSRRTYGSINTIVSTSTGCNSTWISIWFWYHSISCQSMFFQKRESARRRECARRRERMERTELIKSSKFLKQQFGVKRWSDEKVVEEEIGAKEWV